METEALEEMEMDTSRMVILVTDPLLKEDIQEKIIKMLQNSLRNIMILLERLYQMAIKFCEIQPFVTSVIIGATKMEQLKTNIDSVNINLSNKLIEKIGEIQKRYPNPCP